MESTTNKQASQVHASFGAGQGKKRLKPVEKVNLVQEVVSRLRAQILSRHFGPDGVLPSEGEMARGFGVSRTVVREAMHALRAEGLVEVSQGRPPRVRPVDPMVAAMSLQSVLQRSDASLLHLVEARRPLEAEIAGLAAQRAGTSQKAALEEAIHRQETAKEIDDQISADMEFHDRLAAASNNAVFQILLTAVTELLRKSQQKTITLVGRERALEGHRAIFEAIKAGDVQGARDAMLRHLAMTEEDLLRDSQPE